MGASISLANLITLTRLPLLLLLVALLFVSSFALQLAGVGLLIVLFLMDWFDGYVARVRREVTEMGAVLDVALDRAVENILWLTFMYLGMVPLWVPIVFLIRSFIVDGVRGVALARGKSGFGMMHSPLGKFLVASRFMRAFYGLAKAVVFCLLYLTHALALKYPEAMQTLHSGNQILIFLVVALCVVRGVPVLLDGRIYYGTQKS
jgi:CDP-diacylglycerol--glycerol-3-phosphate 3-phosphatidyltransferase